MSLVQLYVPTEVARDVIHKVGSLNLVQFRDLNKGVNEFQRAFVQELRKLDNVERQYTYLKAELDKRGIPSKIYPYDQASNCPQSDIDMYAESANFLESRVVELTDSCETLYKKQKELKQFKYTVDAVENFFSANSAPGHDTIGSDALLSELETGGTEFHAEFLSGVIDRRKVFTLQQILWRTLRGNLFYYTEELPEKIYDAKSNSYVEKNAFIIFSHGSLIYQRIKKIAESLDADLYKVDSTSDLRSEQVKGLQSDLNDLKTVLDETENALNSELVVISRDLSKWWREIAREKAVYKTMNLCDYDNSRKTLIAEGWIPTDEIDDLSSQVKSLSASDTVPTIVNILETTKTPPTFHRTNKFTAAFQSICDTYGVASYREINPGLPTIITFPFMFAIMFGDLGHGFIMFLAALVLVLKEKKIQAMKRDEIFDMAFSGRYILLLMGLFSMYTGFLYNDVFSKSMDFFKSGWEWPETFQPGETIHATKVGVYPIGLDPAWHGAENGLLFSNSYKMKLSVLMGYLHMTYSYFFSLANAIFFNSPIDIIGNFIPGLLFMQGIFGYLSLCIVYKWTVNWFAVGKQPPGLLNMLISMFLAPGEVAEPLYNGQATVQLYLVVVALICVPWLILVKPLYLKRQIDRAAKEHSYERLTESESPQTITEDEEEHGNEEDDEEAHDDHNFGDIMIHQIIHTIEFCLNCVSHTASYLRLWALSLAHAQLSTVLWTMTISNAFGVTGIIGVIMTVFLFAMWLVLTVVILVIMEGTSAMLHSLRLHWVESMSKFFEGEGTAYEPFGFNDLLTDVF
ncbi:putative V-type proton ATPase subunit vacuolar isoform [Clavispora lusitaniae]|uniref:V-type proton ATPase subunit vacuolar isoform n=1 Tax=Clavispora lusitaniae TaxID=36911 RepID=A0ACD0WJL3_CLALS|nr:V-type ATPase family protein [Clavispora lusitaniae]QFZ27724.1 putative V-type proton ATPase subunit vacuolar isoform [Clavispora lusitaniae]QFZ32969.1 putative V-type proton ATPase subunit vacuolar isoform [Clavispora lusitaniae]QFZ38639.1 putative V-type proton ATPase subunit vacuolar isoform [Clavispora lusitaniae]QFZ44321.1 putative V-type proton ATPase subunit vacuolar isoform [Clavispora lusitaniae]